MDVTMTFPICKADEIVHTIKIHILSEAEAKSISESCILQPKADVMQNLYMRLLQSLLPLRNEHFFMSPFTENIYYEFMEGTIPLVNISVYMEKCMPLFRVYDLKKKDLIYPTPKRTLRFWSALHNFLKFQFNREDDIRKDSESMNATVQNCQTLTNKNEEFQARIKKMKMVPAQLEEEITPLAAEVASLQENLDQDIKKAATKRTEEYASNKYELAEKVKMLNDVKVGIATSKEKQALLRRQIVESPEQLKEELRRLKENIVKVKIEMTEKKTRLHELSLQQSKMTCKVEVYEVSLKSMEESEACLEEQKLILEHLQRLQNELDMNSGRLKTLTANEDHRKQVQATRQSQWSKVHLKAENCKQENTKELEHWLEVWDRLDKKCQINSEDLNVLLDQKRRLEEVNADEMRVLQHDKRKINEKFNIILQAMEDFHSNIFMQLNKHKKDQTVIWEKRNKVVESLRNILSEILPA